MSKEELPIRLRKPHSEDIPFIFSSWLKSYRHSLHVKSINNTTFYGEHHRLLERIMKNSEAIIVCKDDDPNQIYGYIVYQIITGILVVHYVYIKQIYRRMGLCHQLLTAAGRKRDEPFVYTHDTFLANKISGRLRAMYNPYVVYNGYEIEEEKDEGKDENQTVQS